MDSFMDIIELNRYNNNYTILARIENKISCYVTSVKESDLQLTIREQENNITVEAIEIFGLVHSLRTLIIESNTFPRRIIGGFE